MIPLFAVADSSHATSCLLLLSLQKKGKEHVKELKRGMLKKKQTGIETKMAKLKEKLDREDVKGDVKIRENGLLSQAVIDRAVAQHL